MRFLTFIILAAVIISCNNSTSVDPEETFEPYTVGSFLVTSDTTAEFIGVTKPKAKGDTTIIKEPGDQHLTVAYNTELDARGHVVFTIVDSTVNVFTGIDKTDVEIITGQPDWNKAFNVGGSSKSYNSERFHLRLSVSFACDENISLDNEGIQVNQYLEDGSHHKSYKFEATGLQKVIEDLSC